MNAEEKAEKLVSKWVDGYHKNTALAVQEIATQIKQAEQAAFEEGQREMREKAAKVAETYVAKPTRWKVTRAYRQLCMTYIAERIRALPLQKMSGEEEECLTMRI